MRPLTTEEPHLPPPRFHESQGFSLTIPLSAHTPCTSPTGSTVWKISAILGDSHFDTIAGLRFHNGNLRVRTVDGYQTIGKYSADASHVVLLSVDKPAGTYSVSFLQSGHNASADNIPVVSTAALTTSRPTVYLAYLEGGAAAHYTIDEVTISEKEPDM